MNKKNLLLIGIILTFFTLPSIKALGITPGRTTIYFEPGLEKEIEFKIINSEHKDMKIVLYVEGVLNDSIQLKQKEAYFEASEKEKTFSYSFKLPQQLEPGSHETRIIAQEVPTGEAQEGVYVKATIAVATQLIVVVPYPGKYLETKFTIVEGDVNETTRFVFFCHNLGQEQLDAWVKIEVVDKTNKLIEKIETSHSSIKPKERKEFVAEWKPQTEGYYFARAVVFFDGQTKKEEKWFKIGKALELVSVTVKDFKLGQVAKFTILVKNRWEEQVKASSRLKILDSEKQIADLSSESVAIAPFSYGTLNIYWDTKNIEAKDYDGKFFLEYGKESIERMLKIKVRADRIDVEIVGMTALAAGMPEKSKINFLLLLLLIILFAANVAWWLYFKRKKKEK